MDEQRVLFEKEAEDKDQGPVECLGKTFENDEKRREYYLEKLREKLKDPEFRRIEGFPTGKDEDILALSDPPYYTACPNPFIEDFVKQYGKPFDPGNDNYRREPFAADVSEGKNDPIYNAHSYHTKVPHKAIMRYILHYTEPGDIVFDGFCGTGMTGVAAQLCGDKSAVQLLGYSITNTGEIITPRNEKFSNFGTRNTILNDLSPSATLIAAGYNLTKNRELFANKAKEILDSFEKDYGWMYKTIDPKTKESCPIDFSVWSEIFSCPQCLKDLEYWSLAYDEKTGQILHTPSCPHCKAQLSKKELIRTTTTYFDTAVNETRQRQVLKPVLIHYDCFGKKKKKKPDEQDFAVIKRAEEMIPSLSFPTELIMFVNEGEEWGDQYRGYHRGITRIHDFHLSRQLVTASILWHMGEQLQNAEMKRLWRFTIQSVLVSFTRRNRFLKNAFSQVNRALSGTLYLGSTVSEPSPTYVLKGKIKRFVKAIPECSAPVAIATQSLSLMGMPSNSIDYIFVDPPFGDNLPYAELNFLWEAWLRVFTNAANDTIISNKQKKNLSTYTSMMSKCLKELYRVLKPGHWITVEFHNSKNAVWTAIQESLSKAGFIIADVRILDKGMLTKKQLNANAVNKDLIITAYKPNGGLEERFKLEAGTVDGVWDFIRTHLKQLPVFVAKDGQAEVIAERHNYLLFDRMVAFHVQRGVTVPLSAAEFYQGLAQRFVEREGMYFLDEQVAEYEKKRATVKELMQLDLFVTDEASAIQWLKQQLSKKPQTFQELHPQFLKEIGGWQKHEKALELSLILEQNFLRCDGKSDVPAQVHSYLSSNYKDLRNLAKDDPTLRSKAKDRWYVPDPNKAGDLEKLRERSLLKEFAEYLPPGYKTSKHDDDQPYFAGIKPKKTIPKGKRLKTFRLEAVRAGFKRAWQDRDYETIITVARRIPVNILQEDQKLLMWYDQARTRLGID